MNKMKRVFTSVIKGIDENEKTLTAYISTKARDRMDESLIPDGADLRKFNKNPVVLFGHNYNSPPIAKAMWTKKDNKGLISKMKFADTEFAKEIFELYKGGFMRAFSVGFLPTEWQDGDGQKTPLRTYKKWELLEYSAVPVPANPEALTLAMQKGILKDEGLIKAMEEELPAHEGDNEDDKTDDTPADDTEVTADDKTTYDDTPDCEDDDKEEKKGVGDLIAELETAKNQNEALEAENAELRKKVFELYHRLEAKGTLLEITDEDIMKKIDNILAGVIRQAQGKVS